MRTAVISDLHLGVAGGEDVLRDPEIRRLLLEEIGDADRVVLLGDVVEMRDKPLGPALAAARPFFEELGEALAGREVTIVPGNHDHRLAEPLLDRLSLNGGGGPGTEESDGPLPGPTALIDAWLGPASLRVAYPGVWLRDDVYATHGHYLDAHLNLPRAECVAVAALIRISRELPDPATPADYERVLRPIYGFAYGVAQARSRRPARGRRGPSEAAWQLLAEDDAGPGARRRLAARAARAGFPAAIWALNRLLRSEFDTDLSGPSISRGGVDAAAELARRLRIDHAHVITGHTHRGGPYEGEDEWPLPGGGRLHNTGCWVFSTVFHHPGRPPGPYWPGTVTWVEGEAPPRRVRLLREHSHDQLTELVERVAGAA